MGLDGFQSLLQAQCRSENTSSTSQSWKRNFTNNLDARNHSKYRSKTEPPLSKQQIKEAYCQLEINYRFKPHLTKTQLQALAIVVELPYDEVQNFYQRKQSQPPSYISTSSKLGQGQHPKVSNPAKRHRRSDSSSSSAYWTNQSDSTVSLQTSERNVIPRVVSSSHQIRELSPKPYECTWRDCLKSFASKSDWKRHEEVHCPQWYWICTLESRSEENSSTGIPCPRKFKRDDHLREHLKKDHKCADGSKVEAGRKPLIPHNPFNRQCGFCGQTTRFWLDRIDHVAEHFKSGKSMAEWKDPWYSDGPEEGSDPSDNDDDDDYGGRDGKANDSSASDKQDHSRKYPGNDNKRGGNMDTPSGGYQVSGNGYTRPGSFGIKYGISDVTGRLHDDSHSINSFWSKMRNVLKTNTEKKDNRSAGPAKGTESTSLMTDSHRGKEEKMIHYFCVLCLGRISTDPSLQNVDASYCNCSMTAVEDHILSLTSPQVEIRLSEKSTDGICSQEKDQEVERKVDGPAGSSQVAKLVHHYLPLTAQESGLGEMSHRRRAAFDQVENQLSFSMQRFLKIASPERDSSVGSGRSRQGQSISFIDDEDRPERTHQLDALASRLEDLSAPRCSWLRQDTSVSFISEARLRSVDTRRAFHERDKLSDGSDWAESFMREDFLGDWPMEIDENAIEALDYEE
jgi:hypothetical protein